MRKPWLKLEDEKLINYIKAHGSEGCCWSSVPRAAGLHRRGQSCKQRWMNHLRVKVEQKSFHDAEDDLIIKLHALLGDRWSLIAGRLLGRTDTEVNNYWNSHLKQKLISLGIDPNNHQVMSHSRLHQQYKGLQRSESPLEDDQVSDTATSRENKACIVPYLNLDLTLY